MGMAASQARYLALLARKSNCEYEGQQINQSRLALSNQSADLFNQMMGLQVPSTPSKSDYTIQKYTFSDGLNTFTMDKWNRLAEADSDGYNYVVTYHYDTVEYTGYQKYKLDPQVQFSGVAPTQSTDPDAEVRKIEEALKVRDTAKAEMDKRYTEYQMVKQLAGKIATYKDSSTVKNIESCTKSGAVYTVNCKDSDPASYAYTEYDSCEPSLKVRIKDCVQKLVDYGALEGSVDELCKGFCYNQYTDSIAFKSDLNSMVDAEVPSTILDIYHLGTVFPAEAGFKSIEQMDKDVKKAEREYVQAKSEYEAVADVYSKYDIPTKIGNIQLTPISALTDNQLTAITQIIADMKDEEIDNNIVKCFDTLGGQYTAENYKGGLYSFEMVGVTYYTTYYDLYNSIVNGTGINHIDDQAKLPYYAAQDMEKPVTKTTRALIDKDKSGRFVTMKLEDDSYVYGLKSVTETDEVAYEDAMNEYTYQRALYDKQVSDINAKTSIIQRQDQNLELRLKQLDTEQSALNTEIEAVSKVVKDNIEKSFKTFSG